MSNPANDHHRPKTRRSRVDALPTVQARVFLQDPRVAQTTKVGLSKVQVSGEVWLGNGPTSARFRVVDHDHGAKTTHPGAAVRNDRTGFEVGRGNPATNYRFHQVNVWATVARLLEHLESPKVFGRRIPWAFPGTRLELRPHAEVLENAYYERESRSIRFGYFDMKGQRVFTCLSHDVIAHEFGHAVLDGVKPLYEGTDGPDLAAFHEFFGDAVAMASALTMRDLITKLLRSRRAKKSRDSLSGLRWIIDLMEEWGAAYGDRYIRSARNRVTMEKLRGNFEEHDRSLVLSGAAYDIFRAIYTHLRRREDEADAVIHAADHTSRLIFRAVDYCPPAGLDFQTYATALLRADEVAYPVDDRGYRDIVRRVLAHRGITLAPRRPIGNDDLRPYDIDQVAASETDAYIFLDANREVLGIPRRAEVRVARVFRTRKAGVRGSFPPREIVLEFVWREGVRLTGTGLGSLTGSIADLWCGGTLVFDSIGNLLHYALADGNQKRRRLLESYLRFMVREGYFDDGSDAAHATRARATIGPDGTLHVSRNAAARCAIRRR